MTSVGGFHPLQYLNLKTHFMSFVSEQGMKIDWSNYEKQEENITPGMITNPPPPRTTIVM